MPAHEPGKRRPEVGIVDGGGFGGDAVEFLGGELALGRGRRCRCRLLVYFPGLEEDLPDNRFADEGIQALHKGAFEEVQLLHPGGACNRDGQDPVTKGNGAGMARDLGPHRSIPVKPYPSFF